MYPYTPIPVREVLRVQALITALDVERPQRFYFSGEMHDFWELVYVKSGKITVTADERLYHLESGKLLFHKPMEFHRLWNSEAESARVMILSFVASGEGMEEFRGACFSLTAAERDRFEELTACFLRAVAAKDSGDFPYLGQVAASAMENFLLGISGRAPERDERLSFEEKQYRAIVRVMKAHCEDRCSVEELAALCGMGVSNMKRIFRRYADRGIAGYYRALKMRRAGEMLDEGRPVKEVAAALGFEEPAYFYTVFKREYGVTPSEYRGSGRARRGRKTEK